MNDIYLGSHVSMSAPDYLLGSVEEALKYGANTFMIYTGAPRNSVRTPVERLNIVAAHELMAQHGIDAKKVIVHAPYTINLANSVDGSLFHISKKILANELARVEAMGLSTLVLHPGSHGQAGPDIGMEKIIEGLNVVLDNDVTGVRIALETMSGKGSECGTSIEQIAGIIGKINKKAQVGICLDTCHLHDSGYDIKDFGQILKKVDELIGLDKIFCVHINDSKNPMGSKKDRHDNIGYGSIGFEVLLNIVTHPLLDGVPKILETPYFEDRAPYGVEIAMLRSGKYLPEWRENLLN